MRFGPIRAARARVDVEAHRWMRIGSGADSADAQPGALVSWEAVIGELLAKEFYALSEKAGRASSTHSRI